ncbi:triose-phosphate isomerase [Rubrivirga sp. IMCC43871]|uniref:triose-phosphate isomerase n=1 Tax=Rubrivirga sp. IMCC43871 TaxID=3391575 RepID=UPI00398FADD9
MLVAGNWKMNLDLDEAVRLAAEVVRLSGDDAADVGVAVCPPTVWLEAVAERVAGSPIALGAQNVHPADSGAYTGEVSAAMLRGVGADYAIVGHSERRALFGETSAFVAEKVRAAQAGGLTPILCVGETLEEREAGGAEETVVAQLAASMDGVEGGPLVVAYEPVWAIGTGRTASPEQAQAVHAAIRAWLSRRGLGATKLQYGGSVKPGNAADLFAQPDIDGALVGGASLDAPSFAAIVAAARASR